MAYTEILISSMTFHGFSRNISMTCDDVSQQFSQIKIESKYLYSISLCDNNNEIITAITIIQNHGPQNYDEQTLMTLILIAVQQKFYFLTISNKVHFSFDIFKLNFWLIYNFDKSTTVPIREL